MKIKRICHLNLFLLSLLCGCSSRHNPQTDYIPAYQEGNFSYSEEKLNQTIEKKHVEENYQNSKDAVWLLLDRATIHFAQGKTDLAINDYKLALEAIDFYSQSSTPERISQILLSDDVEAYSGEDFEQILARVYFALALIQNGDTGNAYALLQQAEDVQQKKCEEYRQTSYTAHYNLVDNSLSKYLLATFAEKRGDLGNARILYEQANYKNHSLPADPHCATILVLSHHGSAPYKISGTCPASQVSMAALEIFLSSTSRKIDPAISGLTGIPVPILCQNVYSEPYPILVTFNGQKNCLSPIFDVTSVAYEQLNQKLPVIAARGTARLLVRRAAVGYAQRQDPTLGAVMDIAMLVANLNTDADTRSWSTLPARIDLARYDIPSGEHHLLIETECYPPFLKSVKLKLSPNDLCVINIFNIRPGTVSVQIPQHFISNQEN